MVVVIEGILVKADGLAHGTFDVERLDVLPVLFEEGDEEVDTWIGELDLCSELKSRNWRHTKHDVSEDLVIVHLDVANGNTQAQDLLQLELDGGPNLSELIGEVFRVGHGCREFSGFGETRTK